MSLALRQRLYAELDAQVLIDPHTHINATNPASNTLADVLGYHYYTELAHSAGLPRSFIEDPEISPKEKVGRLVEGLSPIENTIQYSWLIEMARELFGFTDERVTKNNWERLWDACTAKMQLADWPEQVLSKSKLEAVFLTNDFDDSLTGFDTKVYIPCLRTDDLVFHLAKPSVQQRLGQATKFDVRDAASLQSAIA
ncbi:MAG: amidohydrolase, partial [Planctomycetota bacterium]|nr:amidohydrolase [Planctomycetota bacterium]